MASLKSKLSKVASGIKKAASNVKNKVSTSFGKQLLQSAVNKQQKPNQSVIQNAVLKASDAVNKAFQKVATPKQPVSQQAVKQPVTSKVDFGRRLKEALDSVAKTAAVAKSEAKSLKSTTSKSLRENIPYIAKAVQKQASAVLAPRKAYAVGSEEDLRRAEEEQRIVDDYGFVKRGSGLAGVAEGLRRFKNKDTRRLAFGDVLRALNIPEFGASEFVGGDVSSIIREIDAGNVKENSLQHKALANTLRALEEEPNTIKRVGRRLSPLALFAVNPLLGAAVSGVAASSNLIKTAQKDYSGDLGKLREGYLGVAGRGVDWSQFQSTPKFTDQSMAGVTSTEETGGNQPIPTQEQGGVQPTDTGKAPRSGKVSDFIKEKMPNSELGVVVAEMEDQAEQAYNDLVKQYEEGLIDSKQFADETNKLYLDKLNNQYKAIMARYDQMSEAERIAAREAIAEIERQIDLLASEGARTKEEVHNLYGEAIRRRLKDDRVRSNLLRNMFSALGSANSSAYLEERMRQENELGRDILATENERNRKLAEIDQVILSEKARAEADKRKIRDGLNNFLRAIRENETLTEEEKNILEREAMAEYRRGLADIERDYREKIATARLGLADYKQRLLSGLLPLIPSADISAIYGGSAGSVGSDFAQPNKPSNASFGLPAVSYDSLGNRAIGTINIGGKVYYTWSDGTIRDTFGRVILHPEFSKMMAG